jgi:hypothetical protein
MAFLQGRVSNEQAADLAAYIANPAVGNAAIASLSVSTIAFDALFVGQSSRSQRITLANSGGAPLNITGFAGENANFAIASNNCTANTTLQPGASCAIDVVFAPKSAVAHAAQLAISHNGQGGTSTVALSGVARALPANSRLMVEYRVPAFDYYFITSRANEQALLDGIAAFVRTGASFPVYSAQVEATTGITRYYFDKVARNASRGSHFYTLLAAEIAALNQLNPGNSQAPTLPYNEGIDSYALMPLTEGPNGSCAVGLQPVLRLFRGNARFPDDPNHRFTIDRHTYDEFVAQGWDGEGVRLCVPAPQP